MPAALDRQEWFKELGIVLCYLVIEPVKGAFTSRAQRLICDEHDHRYCDGKLQPETSGAEYNGPNHCCTFSLLKSYWPWCVKMPTDKQNVEFLYSIIKQLEVKHVSALPDHNTMLHVSGVY